MGFLNLNMCDAGRVRTDYSNEQGWQWMELAAEKSDE